MSEPVGRRLAEQTLKRSGGAADDLAQPALRDCRRDYQRWLGHVSERYDPLLAFLGVAFALIVAFDLADPGLSDGWRSALSTSIWVLWGVFVADFAARLLAAPSAREFLVGHWLAVVMLLIPTLRVLRFASLLRLGRALPAARVVTSSYRAGRAARRVFSSRASYLGGVAALATLAAAQLVWLFERSHGTFDTFGDALLWACAAVVGMSADPRPESVGGRIVMIGAFGVGVVLIASLAAVVGAYLLDDRDESARP